MTSHINFSVWRATAQIELIRIQISPSICAEVLLEQVKRNDHRILGSGRQTDAIVAGILEQKIEFTDINGRELTVFHYTNEDGADCYYTEFLQDDVAFRIDSENIPVEDHVKCLQALVKKMPYSAETNYKITGQITAIDPYANHIGILLDDDVAPQYSRGFGIELPNDRSADDYSLGDLVEVTFTGEPATICTIWAEQFVDISLVS